MASAKGIRMEPAFTMVCTGDFAGMVRGKGVPTAEFDRRCTTGVGWTPTNVQITCFDTIAESPYGAFGDLVLRPDPAAHVCAPLPDGTMLGFALGDITDLAGQPWECCTRSLLRRAVTRLRDETGLELRATFEHEFMFRDGGGSGAFSLAGFAERQGFARDLMVALRAAGLKPDSFLREYGPEQMEITLPPAPPLQAADQAVILRELLRAVARARGEAVTLTPLLSPDVVGNGVHIHASLWDAEGHPVTHDPQGQHGLTPQAGAFIAGILRHVAALTAITAPSALSFARLTPHRWSAAYNNLGVQDREATVRICPVSATEPAARARQFNFEYRAADACANPHLALAALIEAGLAGLRDALPVPRATEEDLSLLPAATLGARGLHRLPGTLEEALDSLATDPVMAAAFPTRMLGIYLAHKRAELAHVAAMTADARFAAYARVY